MTPAEKAEQIWLAIGPPYENEKVKQEWIAQVEKIIGQQEVEMPTTIGSETHCPTCGSLVLIGGEGETHYCVPIYPKVAMPTQEQIYKEADWRFTNGHGGKNPGMDDFLNGVNWFRSEIVKRNNLNQK